MLAAEIRKLRSPDSLPLVLLTSMQLRPETPNAELSLFAACLTKPVKQSQLHDTLLQIVDGSKRILPKTTPRPRLDATLAQRMPLHLLLADDNVVNQKVAVRVFDQMGYRIDLAADGLEAVAAVQQNPYDIIFMDVQMPEVNGLEATRRIRQHETESGRTRSIIVAMTASAMSGDRERCLAAGMDDYLSKPVRPEAVQSVLERWGTISSPKATPPPEPDPPSTTPPPDPATDSAPVDLERLFEMSGPDEASVRELTDLYLTQTQEQMAALRTALDTRSPRDLEHVAHKAAGASSTCGMVAVVPHLRELENLGRNGQLDGADAILQKAMLELDRIRLFLSDYLDQLRTGVGTGNP
jgi:CheY-like chemotaxis protein/HPt (histidine-containing phosphotransfer) domain-containing protein